MVDFRWSFFETVYFLRLHLTLATDMGTMDWKLLLLFTPFILGAWATHVTLPKRLNNGVGLTPALGWNSWVCSSQLSGLPPLILSSFQGPRTNRGHVANRSTKNQAQCNAASAATVLKTAQAFIDLGLRDLGYTYLNIDDCWSMKNRNATGYLVPDPAKFPKGMDGLAKEVHGMGLKLGLYGDAGTLTCAGYPGSYKHEQQDAETLAQWGVDYWKFDNCLTEVPYTNQGTTSKEYYPTMRDALLKVSRPILFSICQWGRDQVWTWGAEVGNSWRMSDDIQNNWASVASIAAKAATIYQYSHPGAFNDLDMMVRYSMAPTTIVYWLQLPHSGSITLPFADLHCDSRSICLYTI